MVLAWKGWKMHWKNTTNYSIYSEIWINPFNLTKAINRLNKTVKITLKTYTPYHSTIKLLIVIKVIEKH